MKKFEHQVAGHKDTVFHGPPPRFASSSASKPNSNPDSDSNSPEYSESCNSSLLKLDSTQAEADFYKEAAVRKSPLLPWIPKFFGFERASVFFDEHGHVRKQEHEHEYNQERVVGKEEQEGEREHRIDREPIVDHVDKDKDKDAKDRKGDLKREDSEKEKSRMALHMENVLSLMRRPCVMDIKIGTRLYGKDADSAKRERMERYICTFCLSLRSLSLSLSICLFLPLSLFSPSSACSI
jgi:hypothetical protein